MHSSVFFFIQGGAQTRSRVILYSMCPGHQEVRCCIQWTQKMRYTHGVWTPCTQHEYSTSPPLFRSSHFSCRLHCLQLYFLGVLGWFGGPPLEVSGGGCGNTVRYKQWVFRFGYCYCVCVWPCAIRFTSSSRILRKLYSVENSFNTMCNNIKSLATR